MTFGVFMPPTLNTTILAEIVRPHIARIARTFRQQVAIDTFESPGINPCEHEWVFRSSIHHVPVMTFGVFMPPTLNTTILAEQ
jgi:hypothetical protein